MMPGVRTAAPKNAEPCLEARRTRGDQIQSGRVAGQRTRDVLSTGRTRQSQGRPRHNLPAPRSSFVGREREIEEIERELATTRLLTLTGVGGSGKTRLALEVARGLLEAYPEGVWLVQLAPLSEGRWCPRRRLRPWEHRSGPVSPS